MCGSTKYGNSKGEGVGGGGGGVSKAKVFKGKDKAKVEFPEGWEGSNQKTFNGGGWIFSGTTQYHLALRLFSLN